jgi:hypothetical protein
MGGTCGIDDYLAGIQPGILPHLFKAGENVFMPAAKGNTGTKLDVALQHGYQARRCTATRFVTGRGGLVCDVSRLPAGSIFIFP